MPPYITTNAPRSCLRCVSDVLCQRRGGDEPLRGGLIGNRVYRGHMGRFWADDEQIRILKRGCTHKNAVTRLAIGIYRLASTMTRLVSQHRAHPRRLLCHFTTPKLGSRAAMVGKRLLPTLMSIKRPNPRRDGP